MKVTIEVDEDDREALARWFGDNGKASRDTVKRWAQHVINGELENIGAPEVD